MTINMNLPIKQRVALHATKIYSPRQGVMMILHFDMEKYFRTKKTKTFTIELSVSMTNCLPKSCQTSQNTSISTSKKFIRSISTNKR